MEGEEGGWRPLWRLEITAGVSCSLQIGGLALCAVAAVVVIALGLRLHPMRNPADCGGADDRRSDTSDF